MAPREISAHKDFEGGSHVSSTWEETLSTATTGLWAGTGSQLELPSTPDPGPVAWRVTWKEEPGARGRDWGILEVSTRGCGPVEWPVASCAFPEWGPATNPGCPASPGHITLVRFRSHWAAAHLSFCLASSLPQSWLLPLASGASLYLWTFEPSQPSQPPWTRH